MTTLLNPPNPSDSAGTREDESTLVVVGSSAGGIAALSKLVSTLPAGFPAPVVLAQHLDPTKPSHLGEILARYSLLPVRTVTDHAPLEAGTV
jgi:two-component system CheB/CheR fusion protein